MKRAHFLSVGLVFSLTAGLPVQAQVPDTTAVRRVVEALAEFAQARNYAALDTLYAHDASVEIIEGAGVNHGWLDYRDRHLKREFDEFQNITYRYYDIAPQIRGTVAWAPFRYELIVDTPRGHLELEGRGTAILERRGDRWVVVHKHTSGRRRGQ